MKSVKMNENQIQEFTIKFKDYETDIKNEYIDHFYKINGATVSIFKSGKVLFQGSNLDVFGDYFNTYTQLSLDLDEDDTPYDYMDTIGADEVGTGDTFGPIVCASVFVRKSDIEYLKELGVKDSKKLSDERIMKLGKIIEEKFEHQVNILRNEIYNDIKDKYNMNEMKARLHNQNILLLSKRVKYEAVCLDEFVNRDKYFSYLNDEVFKDISFEMKGESKSCAVAAASILARYFFLLEYERLIKEYGYSLPKGSGTKVKEMIEKIRNEKKDDLFYHIAKTNFKNFD
ncbi:ribonuclease HIII [bacterium]|nr:ribonuclease HIII [bacterium]